MKQVAQKISLLLMLLGSLSLSAQTIYVNSKATGANDGSSWANAYTKLEPALAAAANGTEIWVAAGVYKPDPASSTTASYSMKKAAKLYGGFKGTETALSQRNIVANPTILDGDIKGDDVAGNLKTNRSDNSVHVILVEIPSGSPTAEIDGFTIRNGNTKLPADPTTINKRGGGIYAAGKVKIANCIFTRNSALVGGGVHFAGTVANDSAIEGCVFNNNEINDTTGAGSALSIISTLRSRVKRCTFTNNLATNGAFFANVADDTVLDSCLFEGNSSFPRSFGSAMAHFNSRLTINNTIFRNNKISGNGIIYGDGRQGTKLTTYNNCTFEANENIVTGGFGGGTLYTWQLNLAVRNCNFVNNKARNGSGFFANGSEATSSILFENTTFNGNEAASSGGAVYFNDARATLRGCTIEANLSSFAGGVANYGARSVINYDNCTIKANTTTSGGAGMHTGFRAQVNISNSTFEENVAASIGGAVGIQNDSSKLTINGSVFRSNQATNAGGAIGAFLGTNEIAVTNTVFEGNSGGSAGAIQILENDDDFSLLTLSGCKFVANKATTTQGGAINGSNANMDIVNCLFADNNNDGSGVGGAIISNAGDGQLVLAKLTNCTFANNISSNGGAAVAQWEDKATAGSSAVMELQNCIFSDNIPGAYIIEDGTPELKSLGGNFCNDETMQNDLKGTNDISGAGNDAKFRDNSNDFRLQQTSPCRDKGIANGAPAKDIDGNTRDSKPDMGAYEFVTVGTGEPLPLAIQVTPNPSHDVISTSFDADLNGLVLIEVSTINGTLARSIRMENIAAGQIINVPVSDLPAGTYVLRVRTSGQGYIGNFVKQ
jgi:predicted outer membrane repeat protein